MNVDRLHLNPWIVEVNDIRTEEDRNLIGSQKQVVGVQHAVRDRQHMIGVENCCSTDLIADWQHDADKRRELTDDCVSDGNVDFNN